jgi:hypothetical protein
MNFTESFDQFASRLSTMDLALYAGVGLVLWVLFKDRLSPVQQLLGSLINKGKSLVGGDNSNVVKPLEINLPNISPESSVSTKEDVFFKLVVSWKQTRDLAVASGCKDAVDVADQMFPYLSPNVCSKKEEVS